MTAEVRIRGGSAVDGLGSCTCGFCVWEGFEGHIGVFDCEAGGGCGGEGGEDEGLDEGESCGEMHFGIAGRRSWSWVLAVEGWRWR